MNNFDSGAYDKIAERLYTAVLADVMDTLGYRHQVMRHDIRPMFPGAKVVGRAATMAATEVDAIPKEPYKLELALLDDLQPGEVVACTTRNSRGSAIWGELLSIHARAKGARGAIIDGLSRDSWGIIAMKFPVFSTGLTPADSSGRCDVTAIRVPIELGEVLVNDGDLIVADHDGCLAIPQAIEDDVIKLAFEKVSGEDTVRQVLRRGASIREVFAQYGIL
jgi:regulator of RNase E activity RraA